MLPAELPKWVHRKRAKGKVYLYFDTGKKTLGGKKIFAPLPPYQDSAFFREYARLKDIREGKGQGPAALTVPDLCERFRRSWSKRKKPLAKNTRESYETYLQVIEHELNTFAAADVEPTDVFALHQKLGADRPGAANQCIRTLSAMYAWAGKPQVALVSRNPAAGIELFEGGEHQPWPEALLEEGLRAEDPFVRLCVNLLYYSGQRIGDICAMGWRKVSIDYEHMDVRQEKTDEELTIALHRDLKAVLRGYERTLGTIIAKGDGTPYAKGTVRGLLQDWARDRGHEIVPHGLRKNAVNALLEAGCSGAQVNSITGQSMQMIEHYAKKRNRKKLSEGAVLRWENTNGA